MNLTQGKNFGVFPSNLKEISTDELQRLVKLYPFSSHLHDALYLRLLEEGSPGTQNSLAECSTLSNNRKNLFLLGQHITDSVSEDQPSVETGIIIQNDKVVTVFDVLDNDLVSENLNNDTDEEIFVNNSIENTVDSTFEKSLNFDNSLDVSDFAVWLSDLNPAHSTADKKVENVILTEFLEDEIDVELIIDKPKKKKKKLKKKKINSKKKHKSKKKSKKNKSKLSKKEMVFYEDMMISPTLALILEKQGSFDPAIRMYEKLILKFPEKSSFFAARIKKLKKQK